MRTLLYRSTQDSKLAGVCSGLGAYFEIDPVFFRLVFLLSILFGGLGVLAYLVMWIMVPAQEGPRREGRRLRLSATERKIGGVCGGLGEYFDVDPTMMRILFVIVTLMSFGFGVLLYLILLLVMPEKPRTVTS